MREIPVTGESRAILVDWLRDADDPDTKGLRAGLLAYVGWLEQWRETALPYIREGKTGLSNPEEYRELIGPLEQ